MLRSNRRGIKRRGGRDPHADGEEVARLHLKQRGVKLTRPTPEQAEYLGVAVEGAYKPDHYRY